MYKLCWCNMADVWLGAAGWLLPGKIKINENAGYYTAIVLLLLLLLLATSY